MIISVSRRTDIPSYYSDWFFNRIKEGFVQTRNPMNFHQVSKISISPDSVDGIVFWSKNPKPMLNRLEELNDYVYYFQFTLNSYGEDIEKNVPSKSKEVIRTFRNLSEKIGANRVVWRYDPILLNKKYTIDYHTENFEKLARLLKGYTKKCTISFIDYYRNIMKNIKDLNLKDITEEDIHIIARNFYIIAKENGLKLDTCAEKFDLSKYNIGHARCIDENIFKKIKSFKYNIEKDKNQRLECGCVSSIDIGMYNTCMNGCKYCYANHSLKTVEKNFLMHNENLPMLCGKLNDDDIIRDRK